MDNHAKLQALWERFENLTPRQRSLTAAGLFGALDILSNAEGATANLQQIDQHTLSIVIQSLEASIKTEEDNAKNLMPGRKLVDV